MGTLEVGNITRFSVVMLVVRTLRQEESAGYIHLFRVSSQSRLCSIRSVPISA